MRYVAYLVGICCFLTFGVAQAQTDAPKPERWIHPKCKPLECTKNGPFIQKDDGTLLTVSGKKLQASTDGGKTWTATGADIFPGVNIESTGNTGLILQTRNGNIIIVYLNFDGYKWSWDDAKGAPNPDCKLEIWAVRSTDGGQTWTDNQCIMDGYNADFMGFIQITSGRLVTTVEHLDPALKRWIATSFVSDDEGKTWLRGNWIDLGGHGHHDGAVEPMTVELKDGRVMMLIRTSLDQFWRAYSDDGHYWRTIEPSGIDASSAPGWLTRLKSGRLALVWNRCNSEKKGPWPKTLSPGPASEFPVSWHREELSIALSNDEGKTWTKPTVIAREDGAQLSYPYILERTPGELWIFTRYTYSAGGKDAPFVAVALAEQDFQ